MLARLLTALTLLLPPLTLLHSAPAAAATVRKLDLPELVRVADLIILATVQTTEAVRQGNRIITRATLIPETTLKGTAPTPLIVEVPGGVIGGIGQKVPGAARFEPGEHVIAFLGASDTPGYYAVVGMAQGKLRVVPGLDGGRLVRDLSGLSIVEIAPDGTLSDRVTTPDELPLTRLVAEVARLLPTDPAPTDPAPTEPAPTEPAKPTDPAPTDPRAPPPATLNP